MRTYSTIILIDSLMKNEEIDNTIEKIQRNIKNNGGEILEINRWGKKRLAYEIKKRQYGYYVEMFFKTSNNNVVGVIERDYSLDENILRFLTTVLPPKALAIRDQKKMDEEKKAEIKAAAVEPTAPVDKVEPVSTEEPVSEKDVLPEEPVSDKVDLPEEPVSDEPSPKEENETENSVPEAEAENDKK